MSAYKSNSNGITDWEEYTTARGEKVHIHAVPQPIVRAVVPVRPKPDIPTVDMQLPRGAVQKRPIKAGDPGWEGYEAELAAWEAERDELQEAVTFTFALKSYKYPSELKLSPEVEELVSLGVLKISDNPIIRKMVWLRENVLGQHDEYNINMVIHKLSGVPEDVVNEMKRNFRAILLGQNTGAVGAGTEPEPQPEADSEINGQFLA